MEGGAHGNEWISVAFVTYLIHQLLETDSDVDAKLKRIAGRYHWYLIPVLNPDGYEYNQKSVSDTEIILFRITFVKTI